MIRLERDARLRSLDAVRSYASWSDRHVRVYVVRSRGLRVDASVLGSFSPPTSRVGYINIQLDGALVARRASGEHVIPARSLALDPSVHWDERWIGPDFRVLAIEWDEGYGPAPTAFSQGTLTNLDHGRISAIADAIAHESDPERGALALDALDRLLRANGVAIDGLRSLARSTEDPRDVRTARLLSTLRCALHAQPTWIDAVLASGRSERQLRRDVAALIARLDLRSDGLRALLVRERIVSASVLLSARGVSVADVARSVGFGTSRALGLALERAGLPTATRIASLARDG